MRAFIIAVVCMLGILVIMSVPAPAQAQRTPKQFLIELVEQVHTLQDSQKATPLAVDYYILKLIRHHFDTQRMGKFVLGKHWRKASTDQRNRFVKAFELVTVRRFGPLLKDIPLDTFRILSVDDDDYNNVIIVSTIEKNDKIVKVKWRLRMDYWPEYQIIDITAEGISLMLTLRAEYGAAIKQHGIEGVISRLEDAIQTN